MVRKADKAAMKYTLKFLQLLSLTSLVYSVDYIPNTKLLNDVEENHQLVAFTNLRSNSRYLDMVFVGPGHDKITVRSYDGNNETIHTPDGYKEFSFQQDPNFYNYKIIGVLPADFDNDRATDLLVVFANNAKSKVSYKLSIVWNKGHRFADSEYINGTFSEAPHLIDFNGDLYVDFISSQEGVRYFYLNDKDHPGDFKRVPLVETVPVDTSKGESSYAFGDLNGDCEADLFMLTKLANGSAIFEFYEASGKELIKVWESSIPEEARADKYSAPVLVDMDGNGKTDIVIAGCSQESHGVCVKSKISVFYNDPCSTRSADKCTVHQNECSKYTFTLGSGVMVFNKFVHDSTPFGFLPYDHSTDMFSSKYMVRAADVDSDGHTDLVAVLRYDNSQQAVVLLNVEDSSVAGGRTFRVQWRDDLILTSDLAAKYQPYALAPVDGLGKGTVQMFLLGRSKGDDKNQGDFSLTLLETKDQLDTFWLKLTVLCLGCDTSSTTAIGATGFYFTTGYKGNDEVGYGTQGSELAPFSLQAPYMLYGLGQQANYIQYIKVAYRDTQREGKTVNMHQFDQLVPNTQVFAIPLQHLWRMVMLVVTGKTLWETLLVLGVCCVVCLIIILILHVKERKEDEREKRKFNAKFNFDAM